MIKKRKLVAFFVLFLVIFLSSILCLMTLLNQTQQTVFVKIYSELAEEKIREQLTNLPDKYKVRSKNVDTSDKFIKYLNHIENYQNIAELWKEVNAWVDKGSVYSMVPKLPSALSALKRAKVIKADLDGRGSQLKLLLSLEGNQKVVFKPKRYEKDEIIEGVVYAGKDRYGSEILAFYLSGILNRTTVPLSVERTFNLKEEILPVGSENLLKTTFIQNNRTCVYGLCYYCSKADAVCTDNQYFLTGALIFNVDAKFKQYRNPWRRTYKRNKPAPWEIDENYCKAVVKTMSQERILDLIDVSIFDFLIQNGDRHHYEVLDGHLIWLDNGKGLGNPNVDHFDILAPLYECCILRKNTFKRLQELSGGLLREKLEQISNIRNFVAEKHFSAIDRRLLIVYATMEYCVNNKKHFILVK